jgi:hypothetical protein
LKEKINGSDSTINANRKRVIPNTEKEEVTNRDNEILEKEN